MDNSFMEIKDGNAVIHIEGAAVIDTAQQIHQVFSDALESQYSIILDLSKITECDSTFIQLLASLCYTMNHGGRGLSFSSNVLPKAVFEKINILGFNFKEKCPKINGIDCLLACCYEQKELLK